MSIGDATQYVMDGEGHKVAVVVPVAEYEELLEDLHDLAIIAERRDEPRIPWDEVKRQLREDGLLHD